MLTRPTMAGGWFTLQNPGKGAFAAPSAPLHAEMDAEGELVPQLSRGSVRGELQGQDRSSLPEE